MQQQAASFTADPVVGKPSARSRNSDAVGQPVGTEAASAAQLAGLGLANGSAGFFGGGEASGHIPIPAVPQLQQPGFQPRPDGYQGSPGLSGGQWSPAAVQQLLDQQMADQALLSQLQAQLQLDQAMSSPGQGALAQLLAQQLQQQQAALAPELGFQGLPPLPAGQWGGHARSPPPLPAALGAPQAAELPGMKHAGFGGHDDKKHRGHGPGGHGPKARAAEPDTAQGGSLDKLRREVARLHAEAERLEREVARQKALREAERAEFTDAKERLKHSWAADREDFARVKALLKAKNAEHHAQGGRLSAQLKEAEAANRGLRELCARAGVPIPPELEQAAGRGGAGAVPPPASSAESGDGRSLSRAQSGASFDSEPPGRAGPVGAGGSQPPSPTSAAGAVRAMERQLARMLAPRPSGPPPAAGDDEAGDSGAAAVAAAQAAAALGQLAAALAARPGGGEAHAGSRPSTPRSGSPAPANGSAAEATDLNRMSLQAWVHGAEAGGSGSPGSRARLLAADGGALEFPRVAAAAGRAGAAAAPETPASPAAGTAEPEAGGPEKP